MARLAVAAVDAMMAERPDSTLEAALDVFEVFASGSLTDEVYILEDVAGKRIAIAPTADPGPHGRPPATRGVRAPPQRGLPAAGAREPPARRPPRHCGWAPRRRPAAVSPQSLRT